MSKPDISQEPPSEASSPSPGVGGPLPSIEPPRGYPASVPVTPTTYDFGNSNVDDNFRSHSISGAGASGQVHHPRSANVSRKSSLAKMHAMPLALKIEQGYLNPCDGFPRALWEQNESPTPVLDQFRTLEDTASAFWRLTSGDPSTPFLAPHENPDAMISLTSLESVDLPDETLWQSQGPSRMGSIDDQGMISTYPTGPYDSGFDNVPGLMSASASTASLTASISEVSSQYAGVGGDGGDGSGLGQFRANQWGGGDPSGGHGSYELESPMKVEPFDSTESGLSFYTDEDSPYPFPPQHLHPVRMSHV
ncbi:hypothetical protein BDD12DRAFT_40626 [Trichophaea hybrida]|nr:hypothetical protein BDD12DRAFT_40626 [Trichophaea hybrida]